MFKKLFIFVLLSFVFKISFAQEKCFVLLENKTNFPTNLIVAMTTSIISQFVWLSLNWEVIKEKSSTNMGHGSSVGLVCPSHAGVSKRVYWHAGCDVAVAASHSSRHCAL